MWQVFESSTAVKQIKKLPKEIIKKYEFWLNIVEVSGPHGLKTFSGFKDHSLKGEWRGARASRLSKQWRVIYISKKETLEILVLEVNPHEY